MTRIIILILTAAIYGIPAFGQYEDFALHRGQLAKKLGSNTIGVVVSPGISTPTWVKDKNFFYLTGFEVPGALLVIDTKEKGNGVIYIDDRLKRRLPADIDLKVKPVQDLATAIRPFRKVYLPVGDLSQILTATGNDRLFLGVDTLIDITLAIQTLRLVKTDMEVEKLKAAINATTASLLEAIRQSRVGQRELDLYATIQCNNIKQEVEESFCQVASGPNSTNVHFNHTKRSVAKGDIIVFDAGAYYQGYTSDISRTFPVGGKFSPEQKQIYTVVLNAQKVGIGLMQPGADYSHVQRMVRNELIKGLYGLGLMTDSASAWQQELYIQHGFSHSIGLDVHDVHGFFMSSYPDKRYLPGMVLTMEPGLYFPESMLNGIPERLKNRPTQEEFDRFVAAVGQTYRKYVNIGVRIEDDILITTTGNINLTAKCPKEVEEIEKVIR